VFWKLPLPVGQPRFWVESRRNQSAIGVWYRAESIEEARHMKEFFARIGNQFVVVHGWVGLMYVPFESVKRQAPLELEQPHEQVQLMAVPFTQ
jgi:hypothetical protein